MFPSSSTSPRFETSDVEDQELIREKSESQSALKASLNHQLILSREISKSSSTVAEDNYASRSHRERPRRLSSTVGCDAPAEVKNLVSFQRVILTNCEEDFSSEESIEQSQVCIQIEACRALRRRYHRFCHPAPYFGPFDPKAHAQVQEKADEEFLAFWGPKARGTAQTVYEASFPDSPSRIVTPPGKREEDYEFKAVDGVYRVFFKSERLDPDLPTVQEFLRDVEVVNRLYNLPQAKTVTFKRLQLLEARFSLHRILNATRESLEQKKVSHRDFYNVRKVDCHIHHSAIMTQKHLLRFIKHKLKRCGDDVVIERNQQLLTLNQVFESLGLTAYDLSIDHLDMHADNTFHRFDRFNLKYNPVGESRFREIFLKANNLIEGRYLAEITKEVFKDLEENKFVLVEPRLSVYGNDREEWAMLGKWYCKFKLASPNVRWMIQIPRLYSVYKSKGLIHSFQDLLANIFHPLFACTLNPLDHVELDLFLNSVVGLDCVDDESKVDDASSTVNWPTPENWTRSEDPPYSYWIYYLYANLRELNTLRAKLKKTTFSLRPHAGESGDLSHLSCTYLLAESINHGIMLRKSPVLQYLYYLDQIGLAVSPLSNNSLFVEYESNPFPFFFSRGLLVTITTDDPLLLHKTKDPLAEEYSVASQVWKLSGTDMCEIARNSVLISGLEHPFKAHFLGSNYFMPGVEGNHIDCTNVPDVRVQYRSETLQAELEWVLLMKNRDFSMV